MSDGNADDAGAGANAGSAPVPTLAWILLAGLTLAWGSMWPFLKLAVSEIPLLTFRSGSALVAGLVMLGFALVFGGRIRPAAGEVPKILLVATFTVTLWFFLSAYGVSLLPAGRAVLLAYTMPLFAMLIGVLWLGERITIKRCFGVLTASGAVLVLAWDDLFGSQSGNLGLPIGIIVMLGAAFCWSLGSTLQKHATFQTPVHVLVGWMFLAGSIPLGIAAAAIEPATDWTNLSVPAIVAALSVTLISQAFGLWCWSMILKLTDVAFASIAVLTVPLAAQVLSFLILGERFGIVETLGLSLILLSLGTVLPIGPMIRRMQGGSAT